MMSVACISLVLIIWTFLCYIYTRDYFFFLLKFQLKDRFKKIWSDIMVVLHLRKDSPRVGNVFLELFSKASNE